MTATEARTRRAFRQRFIEGDPEATREIDALIAIIAGEHDRLEAPATPEPLRQVREAGAAAFHASKPGAG
jgi:hypothetical protein